MKIFKRDVQMVFNRDTLDEQISPPIKPRLNAKFFAFALCAWAFFSTLLPWELIYSFFEKGRENHARDNPER